MLDFDRWSVSTLMQRGETVVTDLGLILCKLHFRLGFSPTSQSLRSSTRRDLARVLLEMSRGGLL
jgi:hypothetical protein